MYATIITSIREETPGVKTFTLTYDYGGAISYLPGQFITLVFTHHGKEERRSYSISSNPATDDHLSFTVKRIDNGAYSRLLTDRAQAGDVLYASGIAGLFTLPEDMTQVTQFFFFAAGIGITPVLPLVKTLLYSHPQHQVVLIYSNRSREEVVFYDELAKLAEAFPQNFKVEFLYSTSYNLARARLSKELMPRLLMEYGKGPVDQMLFYICGPFVYMRMVILSLEELGAKDWQIKKENFNTNDRNVIMAEPPDKRSHRITITMGGKQYSFPVQYPDTILQAARKHGIALPYSCEVGRCGSCAALCTSGKVWLSYNEVLMNSDIASGKILTCVAHPVDGDVTIVL